jgi:hypothetical protein
LAALEKDYEEVAGDLPPAAEAAGAEAGGAEDGDAPQE